MRLVIDLQGAQAAHSARGIGRYSLSMAQALVRARTDHTVYIALNGAFPESIESIRGAFHGVLPQDHIRVWNTPGPVCGSDPDNDWRRKVGERQREAVLASLEPDVVLVSSLFEGFLDDAVTSIGTFDTQTKTAAILYDFIPLVFADHYLADTAMNRWYGSKLDHVRRTDCLLAISETTRSDAIDRVGLAPESVFTISGAADDQFCPRTLDSNAKEGLRAKYGLNGDFILYTGGIEWRKNVEGLLRGYAQLPKGLRRRHQLTIVCEISDHSRRHLEDLAAKLGLDPQEVAMTGFVPDTDLIDLYNVCSLFVFPSRYEGFGLPVLEAMRCGAPVIVADTSSLSELVPLPEARFDPNNVNSLASQMEQTLENEGVRERLRNEGMRRADLFTWDRCAEAAWSALEKLCSAESLSPAFETSLGGQKRLAYVSPVPPAKTGVASYSAELIPRLAQHYAIDVFADQVDVDDPWITKNCTVRTMDQFLDHGHGFDRVLYNMGNSAYHCRIFDLVERVPGVVMLHDAFLGDVQLSRETNEIASFAWSQALYGSHGYHALRDRLKRSLRDTLREYPCSFSMARDAIGVIVHSNFTRDIARRWYGAEAVAHWQVIPHLRVLEHDIDRARAREQLGIDDNTFLTCSFGMLGPTKLNSRLVSAWRRSGAVGDTHAKLVFVGENDPEEYGAELARLVNSSEFGGRLSITGWVDRDTYRRFLAAADAAVQLRTDSRGETSGTILDCMNFGVPTIVNAHGSTAELDSGSLLMLKDDFDDADLAEALDKLRNDSSFRASRSKQARKTIAEQHDPTTCAEKFRDAIECAYARSRRNRLGLIQSVAALDNPPVEEPAWQTLAASVSANLPSPKSGWQLLIDVSELIQRDAKSGIQRVVRSILRQLLNDPPPGCRIEPVYAEIESHGYRYARAFTLEFLGCQPVPLPDDPVEARPGDVFLGLDLQSLIVLTQQEYLTDLRRRGVLVYFVIYDLLPVLRPEAFVEGAGDLHSRWLSFVAQCDGAYCISESVANEFREWAVAHPTERLRPLTVDWFHLGADLENSIPTKGLPGDAGKVLRSLEKRPTFVVIGTLEPRKQHAQVLSAFDAIWDEDIEANLVFVGRTGWLVDSLVRRVRSHPQLGKRFFWLNGISDEFLDRIYESSDCLIAASEAEGFGLPLIEAARHGISILARDIPVFREVAGDHACYFSGEDPASLATAVREWLSQEEAGAAKDSSRLPYLTWKESARQLMDRIEASRYRHMGVPSDSES